LIEVLAHVSTRAPSFAARPIGTNVSADTIAAICLAVLGGFSALSTAILISAGLALPRLLAAVGLLIFPSLLALIR
jgi:hypothetical protein